MTTRSFLSCIDSSEQFLQMTQVVTRLAREISWIVHCFIGSMISMHLCSHLGLEITASRRLHKKGKVTSNRLVIPLSGAAARRLALLPCILGFPSNREGPGGLGGPHLAFREAIPRATRHYLIVRLRALTLQPCLGHGTG